MDDSLQLGLRYALCSIGITRLVLAQFAKFVVLHECSILLSEQPPLTPTQPHTQPPKTRQILHESRV